MVKLKQPWRSSKDCWHDPSTWDKIPTLPYLPTTVHLWMHTCVHLVMCSTSMPCAQWCHSKSVILTHTYCQLCLSRLACLPEHSKPWPSRFPTESPAVCWTNHLHSQQCQMPVAPCHHHVCSRPWFIHCSSYQWWTILICLWPHLCHPESVKPDKHFTTNVAPATSTHPPATQAAQPAPHVAPTTPQPAATAPTPAVPCTLWKTPAVHTPHHAQLVTLKPTSTAPTVPHHSIQSSKLPS